MRRVFLLYGSAHSAGAYITRGCRYIIAATPTVAALCRVNTRCAETNSLRERAVQPAEVTAAAGRQTKSFVDLDDDV